jgi:hypothetical protein
MRRTTILAAALVPGGGNVAAVDADRREQFGAGRARARQLDALSR